MPEDYHPHFDGETSGYTRCLSAFHLQVEKVEPDLPKYACVIAVKNSKSG